MEATNPQGKPEEKAKVDQGLFLQLPYILIDTLNMSDSAALGFIRLCRQCLQKDKTIKYSGSYRQLAAYIQQSRMTCYRSVEQWVKAGLVTKTETPDDFILTGNLSPLWGKNSDHCKTHQRPKVGQSITSTASQSGTKTAENKAQQRPTLTSTASQDNPNSVPDLNENERKTGDIYTLGDTCKDTFFSAGEEVSCSQTPLPTNDEKKNAELQTAQQRIAELEQQVANLTSSQENSARLQEKHNNQSTLSQQTVAVTQAPLIAETGKPKRTFPDMRSDLNERSASQPLTSKEQERLDAAEQRHKEAMAKKREPEIWQHYASLLETPVSQIIKDDFSKRAMKALIAANATDEHITLTFKYLKNKKLATTLAFIASNLNSVVSSQKPQQKPKSDLLNMTDWTDEEYDHWRRTNETPIRARRAQA